jgi:hypothetical protein
MITTEYSRRLAPVLAPYAQSLILRPGGEVYYKFRSLPPSKSQGSHISRDVKSVCQRKDLAGLALSDATAALLGSKSKSHPPLKFHNKEGKNGFGCMPEKSPNFTKNAKNAIRWGAAAMETQFGKGACVFLTGTLPGSTVEAQFTFAAYSSWFVDRLNKWLLKHYAIDGKSYRISVWELQKRGALHLHALVATAPERTATLINEFQAYWIKLLQDLSDATGVDLFARSVGGSWRGQYDVIKRIKGSLKPMKDIMCYGAVVVKTVAGYLSKYLSKGAGDFRFSKAPEYYPARWWSSSCAVKTLVAEQTIKIALPRFHDSQLAQVHNLVENAFLGQKWGKSEAELPTFSDDGEFIGFRETHVGYVCFAENDIAKEILLSLGEGLICYLADDDIKYCDDLRTYIVDGLVAGKEKYKEILYEMGWDAATRNASKVEQSIALHELRLHREMEISYINSYRYWEKTGILPR